MRLALPLLALLMLAPTIARAEITATPPALNADDLRTHIEYLASDALEGRMSGAIGGDMAAGYIASVMGRYGLEPAGDERGFYDDFTFTAGVSLADGNQLSAEVGGLSSRWTPDEEFRPLFFSSNGTVTGPLVFGGYGITASEHNYDDFAGLDLAGKFVLVLRHEPGIDDPDSVFDGKALTRYSDLRQKVIRARTAGAIGVLVVSGPASPGADNDGLMNLDQSDGFGEAGIPVVQIKRRVADTLLAPAASDIATLQASIDANTTPHSFAIEGATVTCTVALNRVEKSTANVVGLLEGSDPSLRDEIIVVGAHYDHLGWGETGSLHTGPKAIHNGADDNASGTAGVLELAHVLSQQPEKVRRSICFVLFSGEELGLLGSAHFARELPFPQENVVAMINMDMIGRLNAENALIVQGLGTATVWPEVLETAAAGLPLDLKTNDDGVGPSDQTSFVAHQIPVLSFFTGVHDDYHRPSDDPATINYPGQMSVLTCVWRVLETLALGTVTPEYLEVAAPNRPPEGVDTRRGFNVYLGTIPDYSIEDRMVLQGVRPGGPADEAGLEAGDQIVKFGEIAINNVYDYTYALQTYEPGDVVDVVIVRGEETLTITMTLRTKDEGESSGGENPHGEGGAAEGTDAHGGDPHGGHG